MRTAAVVAASLLGVLTVFQLALALGAPAGAAAWGGSHPGVLPVRLRIASVIAGLLFYLAIALVLLDAGGVIEVGWEVNRTGLWVMTGFFALGALANFVSRSRVEKVWGPVALAIAICCWVIAAGA